MNRSRAPRRVSAVLLGLALLVTLVPPASVGAAPPSYVFPFTGKAVSYGRTHSGYPAVDVFGCGAQVVAPTAGAVLDISTVDLWQPKPNDPATRGGKFVSMLGDDGVRYYFAHLASVAVVPGARVAPGTPLGVMGKTGDARATVCHTHMGMSWPCPGKEWKVRRGEVWPQAYLDAWRRGAQLSPAAAVAAVKKTNATACSQAMALVKP